MKIFHAFILSLLSVVSLAARSEHYTCVSLEYPPSVHTSGSGEPQGAAVDIVSAVFKQMGDSVSVEIYPWSRALQLAQQGDRDCVFTIYRSEERERVFDFSNEVLLDQFVYFYARRDRIVSFDGDFDSIKGFRIGTAFKVNYGPNFEKVRGKLIIDEAATVKSNFIKLAAGRVDLVPSNAYTASAILADAEFSKFRDQIVRLPIPIERVPSFIAFSKAVKLRGLRDRFDVELGRFAASGECKRVLEKYKLTEAQ